MKWLVVPIKILVTVILLGLLPQLAVAENSKTAVESSTDTAIERTQIGMYDLLAKKSEVYNVDLLSGNKHYITSVTAADDDLFVFKGKILVINGSNNSPEYLDFTPVHYYNPSPPRIIDGIADNTRSYDFIIKNLDIPSKQLIVTQSGMMILLDRIVPPK